jgi:hypothetical protein
VQVDERSHNALTIDVADATENLKSSGLTQNLGQLQVSFRDFQSNCWVNLRILGQPCEFYLDVDVATEPQFDLGPVEMAWCLVFELTANEKGEHTLDHMHEAWSISQRLIASDFHLDHCLTAVGGELLIMAGLPYKYLVEEAHETRMLIRLKETKGLAPFHRDLIQYYATPDIGGGAQALPPAQRGAPAAAWLSASSACPLCCCFFFLPAQRRRHAGGGRGGGDRGRRRVGVLERQQRRAPPGLLHVRPPPAAREEPDGAGHAARPHAAHHAPEEGAHLGVRPQGSAGAPAQPPCARG